jgi:hypothetical protein
VRSQRGGRDFEGLEAEPWFSLLAARPTIGAAEAQAKPGEEFARSVFP